MKAFKRVSNSILFFLLVSVSLSLSGCFDFDTCLAPDEIISGEQVVEGSYESINEPDQLMPIKSYTFNSDSTCVKEVLTPTGDLMSAMGTWHYEGNKLVSDTSASLYGGAILVSMHDEWPAAFTVNNGNKLCLLGFEKIDGVSECINGIYRAAGYVHKTISGQVNESNTVSIEVDLVFYADGTWNADGVIDNETNIVIISESGVFEEDSQLIEFGNGRYVMSADDDMCLLLQ